MMADRTTLAAALHVALFLIIVTGFGVAMAWVTGASRERLRAAEVSGPIPELVRWHAPAN